jgi:hypothetical protein
MVCFSIAPATAALLHREAQGISSVPAAQTSRPNSSPADRGFLPMMRQSFQDRFTQHTDRFEIKCGVLDEMPEMIAI